MLSIPLRKKTGKCLPTILIVATTLLPNLSFSATPANDKMTEVTVEAALTSANLKNITSAISVIDGDSIKRGNRQYIAEILASAPNVNFSSGASRGRFFQIRGTGERSQFIDPINPSVGLIIDGIDFSSAANVANLFDIGHVEILRGPQGTGFGASSSAGLINIQSNEPTNVFESILSGSIGSVAGNNGDIDSYQTGLVVNGSLTDNAQARIAIQKHENDGFVNNTFLQRDDSANIDETLARAKINWQASDALSINTTLLFSDVDNGYDGFTLDNVRASITDEPGFDRQQTHAISVKPTLALTQNTLLSLNLTHSDDDIDYGYDEDWTFTGFNIAGFTSFDRYERGRKHTSIDARISSTSNDIEWVTGVFFKDQSVDLLRTYTFDANYNGQYDPLETTLFKSQYDITELAAYSEIKVQITDQFSVSSGLRIEDFKGDYDDSSSAKIDSSETLWGAHLSASYTLNSEITLFSRLSKGFKPEGVNANGAANLPSQNKSYNTETLINFELGSNFTNQSKTLRGQITAFYQQRNNAQIKQSLVTPITAPNCPCSFEDYIDNANETQHYGLELETSYQATNALQILFSTGYLIAEFSDYIRLSEGAGNLEIREDLDGRQVANAPKYQFALGSDWAITDRLSLWLQVEGRDGYFFSNRHELKSKPYQLYNATVTYQQNNWDIALWGKNLSNKKYHVRGFGSFGNDPRNGYTTDSYFQFGMPREIGVSGTYRFN